MSEHAESLIAAADADMADAIERLPFRTHPTYDDIRHLICVALRRMAGLADAPAESEAGAAPEAPAASASDEAASDTSEGGDAPEGGTNS